MRLYVGSNTTVTIHQSDWVKTVWRISRFSDLGKTCGAYTLFLTCITERNRWSSSVHCSKAEALTNILQGCMCMQPPRLCMSRLLLWQRIVWSRIPTTSRLNVRRKWGSCLLMPYCHLHNHIHSTRVKLTTWRAKTCALNHFNVRATTPVQTIVLAALVHYKDSRYNVTYPMIYSIIVWWKQNV